MLMTLLLVSAVLFAGLRLAVPTLGESAAGGIVRPDKQPTGRSASRDATEAADASDSDLPGTHQSTTGPAAQTNRQASGSTRTFTLPDTRPEARTGSQDYRPTAPRAQLADCPDTPNCVSSSATDPARHVAPLASSRPDDEVIATLADWLQQQDHVTVESRTATYLHAVFRTPLMGFRDDVEFLLQPGGSLQVRSASRLGRSDLGANRKRVESLRESLAGVI